MLPFLGSVTVNTSTIAALLIGAVSSGSAVAGLVAKRQRDLGNLYKGLYEGKSAEVHDLSDRINRLEAQVALFQSDFMRRLGEGVTEAILRSVKGGVNHD